MAKRGFRWSDPRTWFGKTNKRALYKGARRSRRNADWRADGASGNAAVEGSIVELRNRSRELRQSNRYQRNALLTLASYFSGLTPRSAIRAAPGASEAERKAVKAVNRRIDDVFAQWAKQCHGAGDLTFWGLQTQAVLGMVESGETWTLQRPRRWGRDGLVVPLQIELLEADFVDHTRNEVLTSRRAGKETTIGEVRQGVRFDAIGRRTGYHVHREHPGESLATFSLAETRIVPAERVAHLYAAPFARPGQVRGVPWNSAILQDLRDFEQYLEAERVRLYGSASIMGVVECEEEYAFDDPEGGADLPPGINPIRDANGNVLEKLKAGTIPYLNKGQTWTTHAPPATEGLEAYTRTDLRGMAVGASMPTPLFSGDWSDTNFSSLMAAMGPFVRLASRIQSEAVAPLWGAPIWRWFVDVGIDVGALPPEAGPVKWVREPWPQLDPVKQGRAWREAVRGGAAPLADWQRSLGNDPEDTRDEVVAEANWARGNEIVVDSIATVATLAGQRQDDDDDAGEGVGVDAPKTDE